MPDQPYTVTDAYGDATEAHANPDPVWVTEGYGGPALIVTGDLAAARARLAPVAHIDSGYVSALDLLADALLAIIDLDGCRGDCGDQTGACVPARIRTYLGWETTHE